MINQQPARWKVAWHRKRLLSNPIRGSRRWGGMEIASRVLNATANSPGVYVCSLFSFLFKCHYIWLIFSPPFANWMSTSMRFMYLNWMSWEKRWGYPDLLSRIRVGPIRARGREYGRCQHAPQIHWICLTGFWARASALKRLHCALGIKLIHPRASVSLRERNAMRICYVSVR